MTSGHDVDHRPDAPHPRQVLSSPAPDFNTSSLHPWLRATVLSRWLQGGLSFFDQGRVRLLGLDWLYRASRDLRLPRQGITSSTSPGVDHEDSTTDDTSSIGDLASTSTGRGTSAARNPLPWSSDFFPRGLLRSRRSSNDICPTWVGEDFFVGELDEETGGQATSTTIAAGASGAGTRKQSRRGQSWRTKNDAGWRVCLADGWGRELPSKEEQPGCSSLLGSSQDHGPRRGEEDCSRDEDGGGEEPPALSPEHNIREEPEQEDGPPCLALSFGVAFRFEWERAILRNTNCTVWSFDPSMDVSNWPGGENAFFISERHRFFQLGIGVQRRKDGGRSADDVEDSVSDVELRGTKEAPLEERQDLALSSSKSSSSAEGAPSANEEDLEEEGAPSTASRPGHYKGSSENQLDVPFLLRIDRLYNTTVFDRRLGKVHRHNGDQRHMTKELRNEMHAREHEVVKTLRSPLASSATIVNDHILGVKNHADVFVSTKKFLRRVREQDDFIFPKADIVSGSQHSRTSIEERFLPGRASWSFVTLETIVTVANAVLGVERTGREKSEIRFLRMDIEGDEFSVLADWLQRGYFDREKTRGVRISQLQMEVHFAMQFYPLFRPHWWRELLTLVEQEREDHDYTSAAGVVSARSGSHSVLEDHVDVIPENRSYHDVGGGKGTSKAARTEEAPRDRAHGEEMVSCPHAVEREHEVLPRTGGRGEASGERGALIDGREQCSPHQTHIPPPLLVLPEHEERRGNVCLTQQSGEEPRGPSNSTITSTNKNPSTNVLLRALLSRVRASSSSRPRRARGKPENTVERTSLQPAFGFPETPQGFRTSYSQFLLRLSFQQIAFEQAILRALGRKMQLFFFEENPSSELKLPYKHPDDVTDDEVAA